MIEAGTRVTEKRKSCPWCSVVGGSEWMSDSFNCGVIVCICLATPGPRPEISFSIASQAPASAFFPPIPNLLVELTQTS